MIIVICKTQLYHDINATETHVALLILITILSSIYILKQSVKLLYNNSVVHLV